MTANLGTIDRAIRAIIGAVLILSPLLNIPQIWPSGVFALASIGIGVVLIFTALVRFCPLYRVIGISSCKL